MDGSSLVISSINLFGCLSILTKSIKKVMCADLKSNKLELADLLFYCLTMPGFSFIDKLWRKTFYERTLNYGINHYI